MSTASKPPAKPKQAEVGPADRYSGKSAVPPGREIAPPPPDPAPDFAPLFSGGPLTLSMALPAMRAAHLVFCDDETISRELGRWGFDRVRLVQEQGGLRYFVATGPALTLIAIRGSWTLRESLNNGLALPVEAAPFGLAGKVHHGWSASYRHMRPGLLRLLKEIDGLGKPICLTGHSRGGALAFLAGADLAMGQSAPVTVCSFAAPTPGDAALAACVSTRLRAGYNVFLPGDIVPHVPPPKASADAVAALVGQRLPWLGEKVGALVNALGYAAEIGERYRLDDDNVLRRQDDAGAASAAEWRTLGQRLSQRGLAELSQISKDQNATHHPDVYLRRLRDAACAGA